MQWLASPGAVSLTRSLPGAARLATTVPPAILGPEATRAPAARIEEFDALRGGAILLVLFLHAYFSAWAVTPHWESVTVRAVHLVAHSAVPMFLFMSGFLLALDRSLDFLTFTQRRLQRLALPMVIWMTLALAFEVWARGGLTRELLAAFALFDIEGQYYYLFVLLTLTFAAYPLRKCPARWLGPIAAGAFVVNLGTVVYYSTQPIGGLFATVAYRNPLMWVFAVSFGLWLGRTRGNVTFGATTTRAAALGMAALAAMYLIRGETTGVYPTSYFGISVFLFGALGLVAYPAAIRSLTASRGGRAAMAPLSALAPYAFAVYLVHKPYFEGYLADRVVSHSRFAEDYLLLMCALFVVGGGTAIAAVVAVTRLAPRFAAVVLGVDAPGSRTRT